MRSWSQVDVPVLGEPGPAPRVWDSRSEQLVTLPVGRDVTLYVCGITPYDATHMGHATTYVTFDILNRVWRDAGVTVKYTQNVTDVDDPLIERAEKIGRAWEDIAVEQTQLFHDDMVALRAIAPDNYIGVVESIPLVVKQVEKLIKKNVAYQVDDDIYYDITATDLLGAISHFDAGEQREIFAQRGGDPDRAGKRHPLDALLWKAKRPNDPSWSTALGEGRPGWHIECTAIALEYLGASIDVQGGGSDLKFPHHEMSAAHAESATGEQFAGTYMHVGMVALDGQKMSKSLGNLVFVSKLRAAGVDPMAIRLAILAHHYRHDWEWFDEDLATAEERLSLWRTALSQSVGAGSIVSELRTALSNDLDTPSALQLIDEWANETLSDDRDAFSEQGVKDMRIAIDALLGVV